MKTTKSKAKSITRALFSRKDSAAGLSLKFVAPAASQVCVAGTFNDWNPSINPLKPGAGGEWRAHLKLSPGRYEYLFVVDGNWLPDPVATASVPNPFGSVNSVLSVT